MSMLSSLFGSKKTSSPTTNEDDLQVRAFISDIHKYLKQRLYSPDAQIIQLTFLDSSTKENSRNTTATVELFFQKTADKLEAYKTVLNALQPQTLFFNRGKEKTIVILDNIITDCNAFKANAPYYKERLQADSRKKFLTSSLKEYLVTLESYLETN